MQPIRIDFYLLTNEQHNARWLLACRLLEKAYVKGHKVYVLCANKQDAEFLDELLWTFKEDSFIPHHLQGEGPEPPPPIQIGYEREPRGFNDILLNLSNNIPSFYSKFKRIMEIVLNSEAEKEQSRAHYRSYKANGCELFTHLMK
ncbi:DNA polymerase III subunit chi [Legionella longbeachae]|uniref:Putative DNA polymerase III, chi subunit n=1 Tax=Legionella longbeachae serogroup 1 (strain NSW150) TaxID=661367 RepID=D3HKU8_LEGLN|nr:DNA polymerase III subunit chi [Legionella longbeachae]VEE03576.1 DNA polymerase III, chi subunit [Legionella oakridgensis]HBD7397617.1 DNA polymerase III subunit chi [Legionella pneumophila]ARB93538.1 DNA polymerase III subunit chi [Legionella longbeachae]ARM33325.1 DNA polymerase III subunit chi [Legionella longbeachae]EEZ93807.1 DNA polymerase III subunit chi [Legionella longbeachae D-4968]